MLNFTVKSQWNGDEITVHGKFAEIQLSECPSGNAVMVEVTAPFFDVPSAPPGGLPGQPYDCLWDFEVVEAFFLASDSSKYLEVEFGPHGQHLVLLLDGKRNCIKHSLPLEYSATIDMDLGIWRGKAVIPKGYFPPGVDRFNAYAIHGSDDKRVYEALYPVPGDYPDFHRIEHFQAVDFSSLGLDNNRQAKDVWNLSSL